jgi:hypothetical protein
VTERDHHLRDAPFPNYLLQGHDGLIYSVFYPTLEVLVLSAFRRFLKHLLHAGAQFADQKIPWEMMALLVVGFQAAQKQVAQRAAQQALFHHPRPALLCETMFEVAFSCAPAVRFSLILAKKH